MGGDRLNGKNQKPFNGLNYDYLMWIDSDILFTSNDFWALVGSNKDIVSGLYSSANPTISALCLKNELNFLKLAPMSDIDKTEIFPVNFTGLGFCLVRKGVFEKMKYPWFKPAFFANEDFTDIVTEDVSFCWDVQKLGYEVFVNAKVRVRHEKIFFLE